MQAPSSPMAGGADLARLVCLRPEAAIPADDVHALERAAAVTALLITREQAVAAFVRASMLGWKSYLQGGAVDITKANALIRRDNPQMTDDRITHAIALLKSTGMVTGGDAARLGIGVITDDRMKRTYDMLVAQKLLDPKKVELAKTYTTRFVRELRVMP